jgi:hypothetical protein
MKTFITVKDGCVNDIMQTAGDNSPGDAWIEVPMKFDGRKGDKWPDWFDENKIRIQDNVLVERGKRVDNRGCWYNKETKESKQIYGIDEAIDEIKWTREPPLQNESFQKWGGEHWIVDTEKKERAEKENRLGEIKSEIENAERRQIRPMKAIMRNEATKDDTDKFNEYEAVIQSLRPQVTVLEEELKSA